MGLTDEVREFYDREPCESPRVTTVSRSWLAASVPECLPSRPGARILAAGCGAGQEAVGWAEQAPGAEVVGIDISEVSIDRARQRAPSIRWEVGDLQDAEAMRALGTFDLVLCQAVADYVPDSAALMANLAAAIAPNGALLLVVNTDAHPRARVLQAFQSLGGTLPWEGRAEQRALLLLCESVAGGLAGLSPLSAVSNEVIARDLFPPLAHHRSPAAWAQLAADSGLFLRGDRRAREVVLSAGADLDALLGLDAAALGELGHCLDPAPWALLLFGRSPSRQPDFTSDLGPWRPRAASTVPLADLPAAGDWPADGSLTVMEGGTPYPVPLSARGLEVLRHADGTRTLDDIAGEVGPWEPARADLFRLHHADLLVFTP